MASEDSRMPQDKLVETMKFLLSSVKKLSDTFVDSETRVKHGLDGLLTDVSDLRKRLERLERVLEERLGGSASEVGSISLPVASGTEEFRVPVLNLTLETIVEVYSDTPILLEPFSRPCSITARTLSGEIDEIELESFAQGSTWVLECQPGGWLLIPRPGSLQRKSSLQSLDRLYAIEGVKQLPALLHLIRPARLDAVEVGKRWQLREKGQLSINPDPLRVGLGERMASLEQRFSAIEAKQTS